MFNENPTDVHKDLGLNIRCHQLTNISGPLTTLYVVRMQSPEISQLSYLARGSVEISDCVCAPVSLSYILSA